MNIPNQISFTDFCKLETVSYCSLQLRGNRRRNLDAKYPISTQKSYLYCLWNFHYWLIDHKFSYWRGILIDKFVFQKQTHHITLEGLEHFLSLYKECENLKQPFVKLIQEYIDDPIHHKKKPKTIKIFYNAIKTYFNKNDYPLDFPFKMNLVCEDSEKERIEDDSAPMTLAQLLKILTVGEPTLMQKAVFLCKFHGGLDTSTFADRFNFEAWGQITKWFQTENHNEWDLSKCPVPIKLTRIKTGVKHIGFLDVDAVTMLKNYLNYKQNKLGKTCKNGEPIFVNHFDKPITENWMRNSFRQMLKKAGMSKNKINSHSLRMLLKSTLLACGTDWNVADLAIGHKGNNVPQCQFEIKSQIGKGITANIVLCNRYDNGDDEKIHKMRDEYAKASNMINVFERLYLFLVLADYELK